MQFECKSAFFTFNENDRDLIQPLANYLDNHANKIYEFF